MPHATEEERMQNASARRQALGFNRLVRTVLGEGLVLGGGLVLGVGFVLNATGCGPGAPAPSMRRQPNAPPQRRRPLSRCSKGPPARPPARKTKEVWGCVVPHAPKNLRRPLSRVPKIKPIQKFEPAVVDFLVQESRYGDKPGLRWYRIAHGKVRLLLRIPLKKLGLKSASVLWRNSNELIVSDEKRGFFRLLLKHPGGTSRKRGRYLVRRIRKAPRWLLPAPLKRGPGESLTVTASGEVWLSRCARYGFTGREEFRTASGCLKWAHGRLYPSFKKSKKAPKDRPGYDWKLDRPPGYRMRIVNKCFYCFRGRQGWVMYPNSVILALYRDDVHSRQWLGRRVPLFALTLKRIQGDSPYYTYATNLYEACRGYPVGRDVMLSMGPRPYLAYHRMYPTGYGDTLYLRYDGQLIGKVVTGRRASVTFAPPPPKSARKAGRVSNP